MTTIKERISAVEQVASSAHKRMDEQAAEILSLRHSRHEQAGVIQRHDGLIANHKVIIEGMVGAVEKLTTLVNRAIWVFSGGVFIGGALLSAFCYIAWYVFQAITGYN